MSGLREYLREKRRAMSAFEARLDAGEGGSKTVRVETTVEGRSGVRRIRIGDHQILSDSTARFAGYNLGPSSPKLMLGALSSCITHVFLIQAALREIPVDILRVEVTARIDSRAGRRGFKQVPIYPHDVRYEVHLSSPASDKDLKALHAAVKKSCPVYQLFLAAQPVQGVLVRQR